MSNILKVDEKNCYPWSSGCQHTVQVSVDNNIQSMMMTSEEIYLKLKNTGQCPLHISELYKHDRKS